MDSEVLLSMKDCYSEEEAAGLLKRSKGTLKKWRSQAKTRKINHPPYVKINGVIGYPKALFHKWFGNQPIIGTEEPTGQAIAYEEHQ